MSSAPNSITKFVFRTSVIPIENEWVPAFCVELQQLTKKSKQMKTFKKEKHK